eukprot:jgi/Psemu1/790/gm1.790_g
MSMTSLSAQEEGRAFVEEAAEVSRLLTMFLLEQEHHYNGHCFKHSNSTLLQTGTGIGTIDVVARTDQNPGDEDERDTSRVSQLDAFQHSDSSLGTNDNKDDNCLQFEERGNKERTCNENHEETVPLPIKRHVALSHKGATGSASSQEYRSWMRMEGHKATY